MKHEQEYDRLERWAKLLVDASSRSLGESRRQTSKLRAYSCALTEYDLARLSAAEEPADSAALATLSKAKEKLDQAREDLRNTLKYNLPSSHRKAL